MKNKKELKTVIVLGAPRSGTSMTAGILYRMGVDFGKIRKPDAENPRGYYEDRDFLKLMLKIFRSIDASADGFHPPKQKEVLLQKDRFDPQIKKLIDYRIENTKSKYWGWKATTTSFTIPLFLEYLTNPHFVVVLRDSINRAKSIVSYTQNKPIYNKIDIIEALKIANLYYYNIYKFIYDNKELPVHFVSFENIVSSPQETSQKLAKFLSLDLNDNQLGAISKYVIPWNDMAKIKKQMRKKETINRMLRSYKKNIVKSCQKKYLLLKKMLNQ